MGLTEQLESLGLRAGNLVMVHASMRRVGVRTDALMRAMGSVLGPEGTVMAYVDFEPTDALPGFDPLRSPAAKAHGVLAEAIRQWPGAVRSTNPGASMAAIGARAQWLCDDHPLDYGYGPGTPLARLVEADGKVLLLGSDFDHVTLLHYAEHLARLPNKRVVTSTCEVVSEEGPVEVTIQEFDTSQPVVTSMPEKCFELLTQAFVDAGLAHSGQVGGADSHLISAAQLTRFAVAALERDFGGHSEGRSELPADADPQPPRQ